VKATKHFPSAGFTLAEIMIVVAIIGLLAAIALPNFVRARATAQANACINNLKQFDSAANEFALEHGKKTGDIVTMSDITPYIHYNSSSSFFGGSFTLATCPAGGIYSILWTIGSSPTCSLGQGGTPAHVLP
jgi:prepilin-type N-terminal cleavage/methylation domain-containing protein